MALTRQIMNPSLTIRPSNTRRPVDRTLDLQNDALLLLYIP
jgi:hypothetical protein